MKQNEGPEPRFEWDMVTWTFIGIIVVLALLFVMLVWPHSFPFPGRE
jgi:hypothetical protein